MERCTCTRKFKVEAVKLIRERGVTVAKPRAIWTYMARCCADGCRSFPQMGHRPVWVRSR